MAAVAAAMNTAFRDYVTDGVPSSGKNKVSKSEVRIAGQVIEDEIESVLDRVVVVEDQVAAGLKPTFTVRLATTANITLSGEQSIDGQTTSADYVLVKDQTTATQNGAYLTAAGAWTRLTDFDSGAELFGARFYIVEGTANGGKTFGVQNRIAPSVGIDNILIDVLNVPDPSVPATLEALSDTEIIGRPVAPITGSSAGSFTYVFANAVAGDGYLQSVSFWALATGTVTVRRFLKSGDDFTQAGSDIVLTVSSTGVVTFDTDDFGIVPVNAGERLGYHHNGIVAFTTAAEDSGGYYNASGNVTSFTDASATTGVRLQIGFVVAIGEVRSVSARVAVLEDLDLDTLTGPTQIIGIPGTPATGTATSNATFVFNEALTNDGVATALEVYAMGAGTIYLKAFDKSGNDFTQSGEDHPLSVSAGLNTFTAENVGYFPASAGQYIGIYGGTILCYLSTSLTPFFDSGNVGNVRAFTDAAAATAFSIQVKLTMSQGRIPILEQRTSVESGVEEDVYFSDVVTDATFTANGLTVTPSIELSRDGAVITATGSPVALTAPTATYARYDVISYDAESGTFSVTEGTERTIDPQAFIPDLSDSNEIELFRVRVYNGTTEAVPMWRIYDGRDRRIADKQERDYERSRRCISNFRRLLSLGQDAHILNFSDSIGALQKEAPSQSSVNGAHRDRATAALVGNTSHYLRDGYGTDVVDALPLYTAVQNGWTDDGEGQTHSRVGAQWKLIEAIIDRLSYSLTGTPRIRYDNLGIGGFQSSDAFSSGTTPSTWLSTALASAADLVIVALGMNERGNTGTEARLIEIATQLKDTGKEVLFLDCWRPYTGSLTDWQFTNRAIRRAAEATESAHLPMAPIYDSRFIGALGIAASDVCAANNSGGTGNHPGLEEFDAVGRELARLVLE
jgi:hypothetical protein